VYFFALRNSKKGNGQITQLKLLLLNADLITVILLPMLLKNSLDPPHLNTEKTSKIDIVFSREFGSDPCKSVYGFHL
jgi:hypothetical protein